VLLTASSIARRPSSAHGEPKEEEEGRPRPLTVKSDAGALLLSSPSKTLRLTPLTSALRAARAHDAVLRMYPDLPLRFIKIHGDILVSYAAADGRYY
jgi:hypothetical protein